MSKALDKLSVLSQLKMISDTKLFLQEKEIKLRETLEELNDEMEKEKKNVTYIDIIAEDTVDDKIVKSLRKKINIASEVLGEELRDWI